MSATLCYHSVAAAHAEFIKRVGPGQLLQPREGMTFGHPVEEAAHLYVRALAQELLHAARRQGGHSLEELIGMLERYSRWHIH
ncbi:hypothetical protein J2X35_002565 [Mesorhizobium sp. BE184]|nr:hypothetical protein [Mesorhizobium sp. BE184]MDR7033862.1 hypothetical protein [Mesorhizobium sp. BE184]